MPKWEELNDWLNMTQNLRKKLGFGVNRAGESMLTNCNPIVMIVDQIKTFLYPWSHTKSVKIKNVMAEFP